jgi:hypothetical protein
MHINVCRVMTCQVILTKEGRWDYERVRTYLVPSLDCTPSSAEHASHMLFAEPRLSVMASRRRRRMSTVGMNVICE